MGRETSSDRAGVGKGCEGREYHRGGTFDKEKCNSEEAGFGHTTPVTQFPTGGSPYGCYDMSGNVSELSADRYDAEKEDSRLLRGGSWTNIPVDLRVSYRDWNLADLRFNCASISVLPRTFPNPVSFALRPFASYPVS